VVTELVMNYRSVQVVLNLYSDLFYLGELEGVRKEDMPDWLQVDHSKQLWHGDCEVLEKWREARNLRMILVKGQTARNPDSPSSLNKAEAVCIVEWVEYLLLALYRIISAGLVQTSQPPVYERPHNARGRRLRANWR